MAKYLNDFAAGPLDRYRKVASFDWKKMKIFLDTEEYIEYQHEFVNELQKEPIFHGDVKTRNMEEIRRLSMKKTILLKQSPFVNPGKLYSNPKFPTALQAVLFDLDPASTVKLSISFAMFPSVIQSMGTARHYPILEGCFSGQIVGCYCLTEIGHGSNAKAMRTRATYDKQTKEFILHTPNFEAAKCWAGSLGQTATHGIVFAQLITPDGVQQGLHAFVTPLRDANTMLPFPGVVPGDMGEKVGLNGVDNGFVIFNEYRIPRDNLLNKTGDVMDDGTYVTPYKDPNKRHGASFGALSVGRVSITNICAIYATKGISIALRYAAVRKQFGPEGQDEIPILEYQTHQHRLIPHLATVYNLIVFGRYLAEVQQNFNLDTITGENSDILPELGMEIHAVSSASKPVASWTSRDILQECRESCAGHGYLKASGIGDLRNENDANCTYEGENHVLIQQTSNWLLKLWPMILKGEKISTHLKSADFLTNSLQILRTKFAARNVIEVQKPENILHMFQWLTCYLLKMSHQKLENKMKTGSDLFSAKNENQVFYSRSLAVAYIQHFMLQTMYNKINEATDPAIKKVLTRLFSLHGLYVIEKQLGVLYQGGYAEGSAPTTLIQDAILMLIKELKDDVVSLVDAIAPHDFLMNSVLGKSDGQVYKHLQAAFHRDPSALARPPWWEEIVQFRKSKL